MCVISGYQIVKRYLRGSRYLIEAARAQLAASAKPIDHRFRRIYHYHVRKTGGTSLNAAFWGLAGLDLQSFGRRRLVVKDGYVFVMHSKRLVERGHYYFASSHLPVHELQLPNDTFKICIFRDPLQRVLSHYRYVLWARDDPSAHRHEPFLDSLHSETEWLGSSFTDFIETMPKDHLLRQLFMFSCDFDVDEAVNRALSIDAILRTESLGDDLRQLAEHLHLPLKEYKERRFGTKMPLTVDESRKALSLLEPEYRFINLVKERRPDPLL